MTAWTGKRIHFSQPGQAPNLTGLFYWSAREVSFPTPYTKIPSVARNSDSGCHIFLHLNNYEKPLNNLEQTLRKS
ncbi:Uncharacterized protein TCM_029609 [Theobroma cacao]|uniref:Uncharacterized protein n=1 Tax=Theobroma cacao TaxID=3641 RepID=A0A061GE76_THECC|nr:Uncharacterized protein TCM_029609 [Theobroma cacao]